MLAHRAFELSTLGSEFGKRARELAQALFRRRQHRLGGGDLALNADPAFAARCRLARKRVPLGSLALECRLGIRHQSLTAPSVLLELNQARAEFRDALDHA